MASGPWEAFSDAPAAPTQGPWTAFSEPDMSPVKQHFSRVKAETFEDYVKLGFQQSVTGLAARGTVPDMLPEEDAAWYERIGQQAGTLLGDVPAMIAGAVAGSPAGPIGVGAGAFALPSALREAMMQGYEKGEIQSSGDFMERALAVAWEGFKGGVVGAATVGAGAAVAKTALPAVVKPVAKAGAEITTMVAVGSALEGQLPEPHDFTDAAILLFGLRGAVSGAAKLREIYAKTGVKPEEVVEHSKGNSAHWQELLGEKEIPGSYRPLVEPKFTPTKEAVDFAEQPFSRIPQVPGEPARPTHLNYNYLDTPEQVKMAQARLSELYEGKIQEQRRSTVAVEETRAQAAKALTDLLGGDPRLLERSPGQPASAAELLARKELAVGAAESLVKKAHEIKGKSASPEEMAKFLAQVEQTAMLQAQFLGARAETGRALQILKSTKRENDKLAEIQELLERYGGAGKINELAGLLSEFSDPRQALKFAKDAAKATTWEKILEAWKAGLVSGPITHEVNVLSNTAFAGMRLGRDSVAAAFGLLRRGEDKVTFGETIALALGMAKGTKDGFKVAGAILRHGKEMTAKLEQHRPAIEGTKGEIIRAPFRALSAEDAVFRTMHERGTATALATRKALAEGLRYGDKAFFERVAELIENPTNHMKAEIATARERYTFTSPLAEKGQAFRNFVDRWHLEFVFPFIRTPGNVFKETARMVPGLNLFVGEWRADFAKGGAARDRAIAEVTIGAAAMTLTYLLAQEGLITGTGDPDRAKRVTERLASQPLSFRIGDTYYSYARLEPVSTLIGLAADAAEFTEYMTGDERDHWARMLAYAFAQNLTNKTFLRGFSDLVHTLSDPERYGEQYFKSFAGSLVPAFVGQGVVAADPFMRELNGMRDAVAARVPYLRQGLLPKRDVFGEPIPNPERLWYGSPVTVFEIPKDKVRTEAARLGVTVAATPKKAQVSLSGVTQEIELAPEQRDLYASTAGQLAHQALDPMVNSPGWDQMPDIWKRQKYEEAFSMGRKFAGQIAITPEDKATAMERAAQKLTQELAQ